MKIAVAGGTGTVGRHVADLVRHYGHELVVIGRSAGIDLLTGKGLSAALDGVDSVIDVVNTPTLSAQASKKFFGTTTSTLLGAEADAGVRHHVTLSIVNAATIAAGYYAGKALQEERVKRGAVPWTILRATQFHEFAAQTLGRAPRGIVALVPVMRTQPVAAREVAERLVQLGTGSPAGNVPDLAGPNEELLIDMVRAYARATRARTGVIQIRVPGPMGAAMREGALLPGRDAERARLSFRDWLDRDVRGRSHP
ncbi:SDR family oxidoreductase [Cryobacterium sp. AP23]